MSKTLAQIYDGFAKTYEQNRGLFDMTEVFETFYKCLLVKQGDALDLGCGAGEPFSRFFVDKGWSVTGVDFSESMLALACEYVPEMKTIHADMSEVDFAADSFDAITAAYSLFHVDKAKHAELFQKMYGWLRSDGKMLFTYATVAYTGSPEFSGSKVFLGEALFYSHVTPEQLTDMLTRIGFSIDSMVEREIGGETFLWVTVGK
ncbi:MAG: methyltransferase domain-containing protein [Methylococcales bacterium]|nr:methyltransferase domain-containing protein [Methylococcales bacterium]MBT7444216.1 methyltransferase domain-containing protein [Methylococcales bacterium]